MSHLSRALASRAEGVIEATIFRSRWLLAPFYVGLVLALIVLLVRFWIELVHLLPVAFYGGESKAILGILNLSTQSWQALAWKLGIHFTFVVSGVLFAVMGRIAAAAEHADPDH